MSAGFSPQQIQYAYLAVGCRDDSSQIASFLLDHPDVESGFDEASRVKVAGRQFGNMRTFDPLGMQDLQGRMLSSASRALGTSEARPDDTTDPFQDVDEDASKKEKILAGALFLYQIVAERLLVAIHPRRLCSLLGLDMHLPCAPYHASLTPILTAHPRSLFLPLRVEVKTSGPCGFMP